MNPSKKSGTAALIGLGIMIVLLTLTLGVTGLTLGSMSRSQVEITSSVAFQAAQAAAEEEITRAMAILPENKGNFKSVSRSVTTDIGTIAPNATGTVTVQPTSLGTTAWVTATVNNRGYNRSIRVFLNSRDVSIWNNAVFAGSGAGGQAIAGNVDIRGSVHVLGDGEVYSDLNANAKWDPAEPFTDSNKNGVWDPGEPFTDTNMDGVWSAAEPYNDTNMNRVYDPPLTQTDLNSSFYGTAYIGNNYSGMPADLEGMVPASPRISGIETLGAEVRVKHGQISISGTASVGKNELIDGGGSKATIDGSFVNDGYTGTRGASAVFSDNGTTNAYDIDHLGISFPLIYGLGAQPYKDPSGTVWASQSAFYDARGLVCPVKTITSMTPAFKYSDSYGNSIEFSPATTVDDVMYPPILTVRGVVKFDGDLQLGQKDTIRYVGNGTLYSTGHMRIDGNILPYPGRTFPTDARLGFVTKQNMYLAAGAGSAQLKMAGAFYAQGVVYSAKQNQIAGTFVGNFFDMGTNVPNIYQVPGLSLNLPPNMPGDRNYYTIRVRTWRDRYVPRTTTTSSSSSSGTGSGGTTIVAQ